MVSRIGISFCFFKRKKELKIGATVLVPAHSYLCFQKSEELKRVLIELLHSLSADKGLANWSLAL